MNKKVLILGGYGNFGKRIAEKLIASGIHVILAGRNQTKAEACAAQLSSPLVSIACFDIHTEFDTQLALWKPAVVIHTCGPFQGSDYTVARCCIAHGIHYIDLSDGRDFVRNISVLHNEATAKQVAIISGASTVPALSSAVVEHFQHEFALIEQMHFGISPGQRAERGLATTKAILSYVGKPLQPVAEQKKTIYGWQNIHRQYYPKLGKRWMANCDVPDLDLLPKRYNIQSIHFSAGLELGIIHLGLWSISWLIRFGLPITLQHHADALLKMSNWFNRFGSDDGGMHIILRGKDKTGSPHIRQWFIIAKDSYGPYIPTIPAIILARKLVQEEGIISGAMPCIGLIPLEEYLAELQDYPVMTYIQVSD